MTQEKFLSNTSNKESLIKLLSEFFTNLNIKHKICIDDADVEIVTTAINLKTSSNEVIIVGKDTDLLVILTSLAANKDKIYLRIKNKKK